MATYLGPVSSKLTRDADGHRSYVVVSRVNGDPETEGPLAILTATGLPQKGDAYEFAGESDPWAFCGWEATVTRVVEGEKSRVWLVEQTFTTKPPDNKSCKDVQVEDPLLEPAKISGQFQKYTEEATKDRFGRPVKNSAHEQISGPQNEWDRNRPQVKIEVNVGSLLLDIVSAAVDCVNAVELWGFPPRTIKLSNFSWERKFYAQCFVYYQWVLEFDVRPEGWDRDLLDEGQKVLKGHWDSRSGLWVNDNVDTNGNAPDPRNPSHFIRFVDRQGNHAKVILNGQGNPYNPNPNDIVTGCTVCSELPQVFSLVTEQIPASLETPIELTWVTGCQWTGTSAGDLIALSIYSTGAGGAILQFAAYTSATWTGRIACITPNMVLYPDKPSNPDDGQEFFPFFLFDFNTSPGRIHVEKYEQLDFIEALGIPTSF